MYNLINKVVDMIDISTKWNNIEEYNDNLDNLVWVGFDGLHNFKKLFRILPSIFEILKLKM